MADDRALRPSDVVGVSRLAVDAMFGLTDVVEAMHGTIVRRPLPFGAVRDTRTRGITGLVYRSIRAVTGLVGGGVDTARSLLATGGEATSSPRRDAMLAIVNGVVGDHLAATDNPLAIRMQLHRADDTVPPTGRLVVFVHGLCMNHLQWRRDGHDHADALAAVGWTPLYLHYNTGRHVSINGRELAAQLEALVAEWPVPVTELVLVAHSLGGLVSRSACYYARLLDLRWPARLARIVFLGTPHHGAPLERSGNLLQVLLELSPYAAPIGRMGGLRSAGITDLRFGNVVDEDWAGQHPRHRADPRVPVPLPDGVACYAVAGTRGRRTGDLPDRLLGDGLVPVASALGHHPDPRFALAFPAEHQRVIYERGHMDLIDAPEVSDQLVAWLG